MSESRSALEIAAAVRAGERSARDGASTHGRKGAPSAAASVPLQASLSTSTWWPRSISPLATSSIGCTWPPPSKVANRNRAIEPVR